MNFISQNLKSRIIDLLKICFLSIFLHSCGGDKEGGFWDPGKWGDHKARKISENADVRARQAIEEGRGISIDGKLKGKKSSGTGYIFAGSNPMWKAALEILDFIPLANVDYAGGLIITDWYNEGTTANEYIKITVRFLSHDIRADGISIIVHKKACNKNQACVTKKIKSSLELEVKDAILRRATLIERKIYQANAEEYRKKFGNRGQKIKEREGFNKSKK